VLARHATSKDLWMYRGNGTGGFAGSGPIGTGWGNLDLIFSPGDFDGDGYSDVLARTATSKELLLFRGNGNGGFLSLAVAGSGWGNFDILFSPAWVGPPTRTTGLNKPTYFIHGFGFGINGFNCDAEFDLAIRAFNSTSGPGINTGPLLTVGFYEDDHTCDVKLPDDLVNKYGSVADEGTKDESLKELGREFAWEIYNKHSRFGRSVDVVGHSMGGLIARAALTGTQRNLSDWPPYIFVEDVVTLATPHGGTPWAVTPPGPCGNWIQCNEMEPNSATLVWMDDNPQSNVVGTDWTLLGSADDDVVFPRYAFNMCCVGHKVHYPQGQPDGNGVEHYNIHQRTSGTFHIEYCDYFGSCDMEDPELPYDSWSDSTGDRSPITMAKLALHNEAW
jgi:hypothetical protein